MAKSTTQSKTVPIIINPTIQWAFVIGMLVSFFVQFGVTTYQLNKYTPGGGSSYKLSVMLFFLVPALYWLLTYLLHPPTGTLRRLFQTTVLTTVVWTAVTVIQQLIMVFYASPSTSRYNVINWVLYSVVGVLYVGAMGYLRGSKRRWK